MSQNNIYFSKLMESKAMTDEDLSLETTELWATNLHYESKLFRST